MKYFFSDIQCDACFIREEVLVEQLWFLQPSWCVVVFVNILVNIVVEKVMMVVAKHSFMEDIVSSFTSFVVEVFDAGPSEGQGQVIGTAEVVGTGSNIGIFYLRGQTSILMAVSEGKFCTESY